MSHNDVENTNKDELFYIYFEKWYKAYKMGVVANVTLLKYQGSAAWIKKLVPELKLSEMDRWNYQNLLNLYGETHEKQTVTDFHHHLKASVLDAVDEGFIERDPTRKIVIKGKQPRQKRKKYLGEAELEKLIADLDLGKEINWDWFILVVAKTGMRFEEALGLQRKDFDFENQNISINKSWNYKGGGGFQPTKNASSVRTIKMDWKMCVQLKGVIETIPDDYTVFVKEGKKVYNSTANAVLKRHCENVGINVITIHGLRHTHASILLYSGVSIASVAKRLGHSDMSTTQKIYLHVISELENKDNNKVMTKMCEL